MTFRLEGARKRTPTDMEPFERIQKTEMENTPTPKTDSSKDKSNQKEMRKYYSEGMLIKFKGQLQAVVILELFHWGIPLSHE